MTLDNETAKARRSALLDKISALLAKTQHNGCTEAEALAAAELAQKLMDKYGLSLAELQEISSPADACEVDVTPIGKRRAHEVLHLSPAIAFYTDTRSWYNRHGLFHDNKGKWRKHEHDGIILSYFGLSADVRVATYLTNIFRSMLDTEWGAFWRRHSKTSTASCRTARANFMCGMTYRISERLCDMKSAQSQANENNCREVVLAKDRIVDQAYEAVGIKPRRSRRGQRMVADEGAFEAGFAAGDRVSIASGALSGRKNE